VTEYTIVAEDPNAPGTLLFKIGTFTLESAQEQITQIKTAGLKLQNIECLPVEN
jgi:hypothetical protein